MVFLAFKPQLKANTMARRASKKRRKRTVMTGRIKMKSQGLDVPGPVPLSNLSGVWGCRLDRAGRKLLSGMVPHMSPYLPGIM
jgi:hypothetical protein